MTLTHRRFGSLATITATGSHPETEFEALVRAVIAESDAVEAPLQLLFDVRGFETAPDAETLKHVGMRFADLRPRLSERHAFVVGDELQYGLAHEVAGWAGTRGVKVGVFHAIDEAERWLCTDDSLPERDDS
jgi:hypothetical protein